MAFLIPLVALVAAKMMQPKTPSPPTPTATPAAPSMDSASILATQQKTAAAQQARGGRISTILSGASPTDAAGSGVSSTLGG